MLQPAGADIPFNSNVYETGFVSVLSLANGIADVVRLIDANAFHSKPRCERSKVHGRLREVHLDELASGGAFAEVFEHVQFQDAVGAVVAITQVRGILWWAAVHSAWIVYSAAPSPLTERTGRSGRASLMPIGFGMPGPSPPPAAR